MAARKPVAKSRKEKQETGKCVDCAHAYVMRDNMPCNPLISECGINGERYPESWMCCINGFSRRNVDLVIHPMIYLNRERDNGDTTIHTE